MKLNVLKGLLGLTLPLATALTAPIVAYASVPSEPSASMQIYIQPDETTTAAYASGQQATPGSGGKIVLDFGRQYWSSSTGWGVWPVGTNTFMSNATVESLAKSFISGYNSTHSQSLELFIGTSNDEIGWTSTEGTNAANQWIDIVNAIPSSGVVSVDASNDIEYWGGATYSEAQSWCSTFATTSYLMLDTGTAVNIESGGTSNAWTPYDVYEVAYGIGLDIVSPEVYFEYTSTGALYTGSNGSPYRGNATDWQNINASYSMNFFAVSSENGAIIGSNTSETDLASWDALNIVSNNDVQSNLLQF